MVAKGGGSKNDSTMATEIKNIIGIKCPKCEYVMRTFRPTHEGIFKLTCPKCKKDIFVRIPNLTHVKLVDRKEYDSQQPKVTFINGDTIVDPE